MGADWIALVLVAVVVVVYWLTGSGGG